MSKRYIGWGLLIILAMILNIQATPIAKIIYEDPIITEFRSSPDYKLHMKGLESVEKKMEAKRQRDARKAVSKKRQIRLNNIKECDTQK